MREVLACGKLTATMLGWLPGHLNAIANECFFICFTIMAQYHINYLPILEYFFIYNIREY